MSDDPNGLAGMASAHSGWITAFFAASWGIVLRALIGRHIRREERQHELDEKTLQRLTLIELRLAVIESRSHDRRREDPHPWDEDST